MKITMIVVRTLMGLLLLFASLTYFFKFGPTPPTPPPAAMDYMKGLAVVNMMFYVKIIELVCGLAFITGRYATLAAVLLFLVAFNIVLFHAVVEPADIWSGLFLLVGDLFLAWYYRNNYRTLFAAK